MKAKYKSSCMRCGKLIKQLDDIYWHPKTSKIYHKHCYDVNVTDTAMEHGDING